MAVMSDGERLVRCICGEETDRTPFGCGLGWQPWQETHEIFEAAWRAEGNGGAFSFHDAFGLDHGFYKAPYEAGPFPLFEETTLEETAQFRVFRDGRGITLRENKANRSVPEFIEHPVKTPDDWDRMKSERFGLGAAQMDARMAAAEDEMRIYAARVKANGNAVQVGEFPLGAFGCVRDFMGDEEALLAFITEPDMVKDMIMTVASVWTAVYARVAARLAREGLRVDCFHLWEDMSGRNGSLISPAMVEEFMMPAYDMVADFCRAHGIRVISVDTDGDCSELVPVMMSHGVNAFTPFEVQAGCDIRRYRARHPALGIMGGLDKRAMARDEAAVDAQIGIAAEMVPHGRYVPGFDHHIPPDCRYDLFKRAAAGIRRVCGK